MNKLFLFLLLASGMASAATITIKGKINGKLPETLRYTAPVNGASGFDYSYTAVPDAQGNFEIKVETDSITFIDVYYNYLPAGYIMARPGSSYSLTVTESDGKVTHQITGPDAQLQKLYSKLVNNDKEAAFFQVAEDASKIEDLASFKDFFDKKNKGDIEAIAALGNSITPEVKLALSCEREYYYAAVTSYAILLKHLHAGYEGKDTPQPYAAMWGGLHSKDTPALLQSPWCAYYLQGYKNYEVFKAAGFNAKNVVNAADALSGLKRDISVLPKQYAEYYTAKELYNYVSGNRKDKGAIALFNYLKEQYPKSGYINYFAPKVAPVVAFFAESENLPQGAAYVEEYAKINTFDELVKKFAGKKLYFDVWATWCGPCREEFKYKEELYKLLKANDITIVYISLDKEDKDETWKKMIGHYGLQGYHVRTSLALSTNLSELFNNGKKSIENVTAIPWYILVNADGTIAALHAAPPSDLQKLEAEIKKL